MATDFATQLPNLGQLTSRSGIHRLQQSSDGYHRVGTDGVLDIVATGDGKVEFIAFADRTLAYVKSAMGYPAYYPVPPARLDTPIKAVLMDLDGTTVRSEGFWVWIIQNTIASLLDNPHFELEDADLPYVSGHSVSEHLQYCIDKYCPDTTVEQARTWYFKHTHHEMSEIMLGRGKRDAFVPTPGVKDFLLQLKALGVRIALVTSGLYEKAYPSIVSAFDQMGLGDPKDFYDTIITAGFPLRKGETGTLGELSPKPHPWLYAEAARVGLGIEPEDRHHVVGIEDSGAGICSIRLAGFAPIGIGGGNINDSGTRDLCHAYGDTFQDILAIIKP